MSTLDVDTETPESAAKVISRRSINKSKDGDADVGGDVGNSSDTPERFKSKHMQKEAGWRGPKIPR